MRKILFPIFILIAIAGFSQSQNKPANDGHKKKADTQVHHTSTTVIQPAPVDSTHADSSKAKNIETENSNKNQSKSPMKQNPDPYIRPK